MSSRLQRWLGITVVVLLTAGTAALIAAIGVIARRRED